MEARLQLEGLSSVSAEAALLLPGAMGLALQAKTADPALRGKLERAREMAAVKLRLPLGGCPALGLHPREFAGAATVHWRCDGALALI